MDMSLQSLFRNGRVVLDCLRRIYRNGSDLPISQPVRPITNDTRRACHKGVLVMNKPVILITGALTGIGRATAVAFARNGARLVVSGRRQAEGKALEAELRHLGAEAVFIQADVRHDDEVHSLVDQAVAR